MEGEEVAHGKSLTVAACCWNSEMLACYQDRVPLQDA